ncbi:hypothetical protein Tco_0234292, partial [Tanacetum coccineum]
DDDDTEKHDIRETTQEEEDDDEHDDDENDQEDDDAHDDDKKAEDDDDEELTESDNDGDDFVHPKLTTHDDEIIHEEDTEEDVVSTSLIDTLVTAIMEPSFTAQINRPPTPHLIVIQTQQLPILTPATTTSSSLQNLPNFASLFGFDYRLKALKDNFSELRQTNQYAEALSSIPGIINQCRILVILRSNQEQ